MSVQMQLCVALVDALLVFERSSPDQMDPDIAVRAMENMADALLKLSVEEQRTLRRDFEAIASFASDVAYEQFTRNVPDMLGLA